MGRRRFDILIPTHRFTTIQLHLENPHVSSFVIYARLREWIVDGKVKRVGECSTKPGMGKAAYIYAGVPREQPKGRRRLSVDRRVAQAISGHV